MADNTEKMYGYYISNDSIPCNRIFTPFPMEHNDWPIVIKGPTEDLKNPIYDWTNNRWIENSNKAQGQKIAELKQSMTQAMDSIKQLQIDRDNEQKNSQTTQTQLQGMQQLIVQSNTTVAKVANMVSVLLAKSKQDKTPTTTVPDTTPTNKDGDK